MDPGTSLQNNQPPLVLVCPLDWGLGHASRSVPLIRAFLGAGARVIVAADGDALDFLRQCFPDGVGFRVLPGKPVVYPRNTKRLSLVVKLIRQLPGLLGSVKREHTHLQKLIRETGARFVVSDNRYGLYSDLATCVFLGHQVHLRAPGGLRWAEWLVNELNYWLISRFRYCWVPDFAGPDNLSGELSHRSTGRKPRILKNLRYIGPLSRFAGLPANETSPLPDGFPPSFYLVMLSGPEPQRSLLEGELNRQFATLDQAVVVLRGVVGEGGASQRKNEVLSDVRRLSDMRRLSDVRRLHASPPIIRFDHLGDGPMDWLIRHARLVICRPGYSTLMDLAVFGKKALVIPTPGQTEQEYLGQRMKEMGWVCCVSQSGLSLAAQVEKAERLSGIPRHAGSEKMLQELVRALLWGSEPVQ